MNHELKVDDRGDRLDIWLSQQLAELSRSQIQKLIEEGNLQLNDRVCTAKKTKLK